MKTPRTLPRASRPTARPRAAPRGAGRRAPARASPGEAPSDASSRSRRTPPPSPSEPARGRELGTAPRAPGLGRPPSSRRRTPTAPPGAPGPCALRPPLRDEFRVDRCVRHMAAGQLRVRPPRRRAREGAAPSQCCPCRSNAPPCARGTPWAPPPPAGVTSSPGLPYASGRRGLTLDLVEAAGSEMWRARCAASVRWPESGLGVSALRFYDRAGVLVPDQVDPVTGYRWYAPEQLGEAWCWPGCAVRACRWRTSGWCWRAGRPPTPISYGGFWRPICAAGGGAVGRSRRVLRAS